MPKCNSGYDSCKEKVSVFQAPKDAKLFSQWKNAVLPFARSDRPFTEKDFVCEKHFKDSDIIRTWTSIDKKTKKVAMTVKLQRHRLKHGSIPSLFSNGLQEKKRPLDRSESQNSNSNKMAKNQSKRGKELVGKEPKNSVLDNSNVTYSIKKDRISLDEMLDNNEHHETSSFIISNGMGEYSDAPTHLMQTELEAIPKATTEIPIQSSMLLEPFTMLTPVQVKLEPPDPNPAEEYILPHQPPKDRPTNKCTVPASQVDIKAEPVSDSEEGGGPVLP